MVEKVSLACVAVVLAKAGAAAKACLGLDPRDLYGLTVMFLCPPTETHPPHIQVDLG